MKYDVIVDILNKVPCYGLGEPKNSMRKIKELMNELEYDDDFIEKINDDFCKGFGISRNIIADLLSQEFRKTRENGKYIYINKEDYGKAIQLLQKEGIL